MRVYINKSSSLFFFFNIYLVEIFFLPMNTQEKKKINKLYLLIYFILKVYA